MSELNLGDDLCQCEQCQEFRSNLADSYSAYESVAEGEPEEYVSGLGEQDRPLTEEEIGAEIDGALAPASCPDEFTEETIEEVFAWGRRAVRNGEIAQDTKREVMEAVFMSREHFDHFVELVAMLKLTAPVFNEAVAVDASDLYFSAVGEQ